MNTDQLIDKLTKAISFKFKDDKTAPGLTIAALKRGYYCSIVRYDGPFARGKTVIASAKSESLNDALKEVTSKFLNDNKQVKDPMQELSDLVKGG